MSRFIPMYDLESLTEAQRQDYIKAVCAHIKVPDNLNLVMLGYLDERDGPRRLVAFVKRGACEIIREEKGINVEELTSKEIGGSVVFTARGKNKDNRQEIATGSKYISNLTGIDLDDAIMTAQTRACQRLTLQFVGAGVLAESEINPKNIVQSENTVVTPVPEQPTTKPSVEPGVEVKKEDITPGAVPVPAEQLQAFTEEQNKLRAEAIASLNAEAKPKRRYTKKPRNTIDMGPSTSPVTATVVAEAAPVAPQPVAVPAPPVPPVIPPPAAQVVPGKPKLTPEQIKPFRQRQFKLITDLELAGFAPKENIGNLDKLRNYVGLMFPEVTNFTELTVEQWEKYLTTIEDKIKTIGAVNTIKHIEDSIGI